MPILPARWAAVVAVTVVAALACDFAGLPLPQLFAGLIGGVVAALALGWRMTSPAPVRVGAQAVTGVALGAYVQGATVRAIGEHVLPVALISIATLGLTVVAGILLASRPRPAACTRCWPPRSGAAPTPRSCSRFRSCGCS